MTKALEQGFWEKNIIRIRIIIFNSKLKISNETVNKRKIGKISTYHGLINLTKYNNYDQDILLTSLIFVHEK